MPTPKPRRARTRGNRDAAPYQRASDGKWVATVYQANGKRKPIYGDSKKDVTEKRKQAQREIDDNLPVTAGRNDKLSHYLNEVWLKETIPQRVKAGHLSEKTLEMYEQFVADHINPHIGNVPLVKLSTGNIRRWLTELGEKPKQQQPKSRPKDDPILLSTATIARIHAALRKALSDAVGDELIKRNVCTLVNPPVVTRSKPERVLTKVEVGLLLGAAAEHHLWAYWLTLLGLGLRRGEGLGMRWSDLDLTAGTVALEEQIVVRKGDRDPETGKRGKNKVVKAKLKTKASQGTLRLPELTRLALVEHKAKQQVERDRLPIWIDETLVFTNAVGDKIHPDWASEMWRDICVQAGIEPCGPHLLRHACATFLFSDGVNLKTIQGLLRHTRKATTEEIYVHLLREVTDGASATMNAVLIDLTAEKKRREKAAATRVATPGA